MSLDFVFEYEYSPSPDADERLAQALDLILDLLLDDILNEQKEKTPVDGEPC